MDSIISVISFRRDGKTKSDCDIEKDEEITRLTLASTSNVFRLTMFLPFLSHHKEGVRSKVNPRALLDTVPLSITAYLTNGSG